MLPSRHLQITPKGSQPLPSPLQPPPWTLLNRLLPILLPLGASTCSAHQASGELSGCCRKNGLTALPRPHVNGFQVLQVSPSALAKALADAKAMATLWVACDCRLELSPKDSLTGKCSRLETHPTTPPDHPRGGGFPDCRHTLNPPWLAFQFQFRHTVPTLQTFQT